MVFAISILTAILFVLIFKKPLKKNPVVFYLGSVGLSLAVAVLKWLGISFSGFFGEYIYPLFDRAAFGTGLFVLVMYAATFKNGSKAMKLLMPLRGELSIIASILTLGHNFAYSKSYLTKVSTPKAALPTNQLIAGIFSYTMLLIMIPLFITSFKKIRRKMDPKKWKKLQRLAYIFYVLIYAHVMTLNIPMALRGIERSKVNILVYSIVFLFYFASRILKATVKADNNSRFNAYRLTALVAVISVSSLLFFKIDTLSKAKEETVESTNISSLETPEEIAEHTVTDGSYSATAFGYEGNITVEIVVKDGEVVNVHFTSYEDDEDYKHYSDELIAKLYEDPYGDYDAVSGATFSSKATLKAYKEALKKAGVETNKEN